MESSYPQETRSVTNVEERRRLGKAETPPPTYEDACQLLAHQFQQHTSSQTSHVSTDPPPAYPDNNFTATSSNLEPHPHFVNLTPNEPEHPGQDGQDTMVIASSEDFPRTCSICKKIAAYLVAMFWISISSVQLLMSVGVAHHYHFERFLYGGSNRAYGNAMFMFWMVTLFANIVLLFGIINKNR